MISHRTILQRRLKYKSGLFDLALQKCILFLIWFECSKVKLIVEAYFGSYLSLLESIQISFELTLKDFSAMLSSSDLTDLLDDPKRKLLGDSRPKRLQIQLYHSYFSLLQPLRPQQPKIDVVAIMEPELKSEAISSPINHILIGKTCSSPAILPRYTVISQFGSTDLVDKIVPFGIVVVKDLFKLLVFLDDLQDEEGIGLEGRVGVDEEVVDD